ncbi:MAG: hypothetical protein AB8E82_07735 [Aureispira sp.]
MKILEFESTIVINKPIAYIFQFLSHQENHKHIFKANIDCRQITDGPMQVGSQVVNTASFLGLKMKEHFEITTFEVNHQIKKKTLPNSTHPSEDCFTLKALSPTQTEIQLSMIAWPTGMAKYLLPIIRPLFYKQVQKDLKAFKTYLEKI